MFHKQYNNKIIINKTVKKKEMRTMNKKKRNIILALTIITFLLRVN